MRNIAHSPAAGGSAEDTGQMRALFGGDDDVSMPEPPQSTDGRPDFEQIQQSKEFGVLRRRLRRFIFPMTLLFFGWYMTYVLLAAYAHDFMNTKVVGEVNVAIIFGLLQFISTVAITAIYLRFAKNRLDPQVDLIRSQAGVGKQ
ncbi:MAG: DUF485 domain-containing protein [Pseudonocardiaceae bacterium]|nr:DUF485 domain-containing protein [Pseudonocardiaceae bacterium]